MPLRWLNDPRVKAFTDHVEAEHNGVHDLPCKVCDRLWSRIDFGWKRQPQRKLWAIKTRRVAAS